MRGGRENMRNVVVLASTEELAERVAYHLMATGKDLLVVDVTTNLRELGAMVASLQPDALVVQEDLADQVKTDTPVFTFGADFTPDRADPLADAILRGMAERKPKPASTSYATQYYSTALAFQGIKGGVGTTSLACGAAVVATRAGQHTVVLDLAGGDCVRTLRGRRHEDGRFVTEIGVDIIAGAVDVDQAWPRLQRDYDVIVVDAGRVGRYGPAVRALGQRGVRFYLVTTPAWLHLVNGSYPGYELLINRVTRASEGTEVPLDPDLSSRVNKGNFASSSPFLAGVEHFVLSVMRGQR